MKENEIETINKIIEKQEELENRMSLLEIIAKKSVSEVPLEPQQTMKKVIQISTMPKMSKAKYNNKRELIAKEEVIEPGKTYFCTTPQEQSIFADNNPDVKVETFNIEMPTFVADKHLNDPENKKQFTKKEKINA